MSDVTLEIKYTLTNKQGETTDIYLKGGELRMLTEGSDDEWYFTKKEVELLIEALSALVKRMV